MFIQPLLKRTNSFIRFLLVGLINTLTGLSIIYFVLHFLNGSYWTATFIGNTIGATVSYFLNKEFTFNSEVKHAKGIPRFIFVILLCYFLAYSISSFVARSIQYDMFSMFFTSENLAVLLGMMFYTVLNYFGQRHFVFNKH